MVIRFLKFFLSIYSSIFFLFVFAVCMAVATFIENDFGTIEAKILVFNTLWFELILIILTIIFIYNIFNYKLYLKKKIPILLLHLSFIFILLGAGITRYISQEGTMPITEGESENTFISTEAYLEFEFHDTKKQWKMFPKKLLLSQLKDNFFKVSTKDFKNREVILSYHDFIADHSLKLNDLVFKSKFEILKANMSDPSSQEILNKDILHPFKKMTPYFINNNAFLLREIQNQDDKKFLELITSGKEVSYLFEGDYLEKGGVSFSYNNSIEADVNILNNTLNGDFIKNEQEVSDLLKLNIKYLDFDTIISLDGAIGIVGEPIYFNLDSLFFKISYGSREIDLPFSIKLNDFQMERYPGSDSPSSYASEISVIPSLKNSNEKKFDYRIYMNNILNYRGYRFFQASYFPDESGTILSVNQDRVGTFVTYLGYFLLLLAVIWVVISRTTRFGALSKRLNNKNKTKDSNKINKIIKSTFVIFLLYSTQIFSYDQDSILFNLNKISIENSSYFSKVLIEDNDGRIKPFQTLSSDILRKISRKQSLSFNYNNQSLKLNADQILLGMMLFPSDWMKIDLITIGKNQELKNIFPIKKEFLSYWDFWKPGLKINFPSTSFNELDTTIFSSNETTNLNDFDFSFYKEVSGHINLTLDAGFINISSPDTIKYMILNGENEGIKGVVFPNQNFSFQQKVVFTIQRGEKKIIFVPSLDLRAFNYRLKDYVEIAYAKKPGVRNKFDNAIIDLDERFNICHIIFNSIYRTIDSSSDVHLNFFPKELPKENLDKNLEKVIINEKWTFDKKYKVSTFFSSIKESIENLNDLEFRSIVDDIIFYQRDNADQIIPSKSKIDLEIFYNKVNPFHFSRLLLFYMLFGFLFLVTLIFEIFNRENRLIKLLIYFFKSTIFLGFLFHTIFLIFRAIISGHAPWSDAYESLIFISWATLMSGFIFIKKSNFSLAGSSIVGAILLLVANLNWINPAITNLVPVLNSYWLMIHVSVITSSYGFLALSAFLGFLTLFLIIFVRRSNFVKINDEIKRLVGINEICMVIGLFLLTVGTFLGGVWANESWGRYWGWDPKETWALISVVVYSIILHVRLVSNKRFKYLFSVLSVLGFSSIIMTYFGVNFYLSGLHSYANGEPPPAQSWILITTIFTSIVIILSGIRFNYSFLTYNNSKN